MHMTLSQAAAERENNLDFLRFFFASCVAFTHSFNLLYGDNTDPLGVVTNGAFGLGGEAVNFFFIISGFLITRSWQHSTNFADFLKKRVLRIYPAFLIVVVFCVLFVGPLGAEDMSSYYGELEYHRLLTDSLKLGLMALPPTFEHNAFPNNVNGSLWTIRYEFICYLLLALMGVMGILRRYQHIVLLLFTMVLLLYVAQGTTLNGSFVEGFWERLGNWPRFLASFLAGVLLYLYRDKIPYSQGLFVVAGLAFLVCAFGLRLGALATPLFGSYCVLYLAFSRRLPMQSFGKYGDFSYGIYLYSFPVQQLLALYFGQVLEGLSMFVFSMMISLVFAWLSWRFIEEPCLALKHSWPEWKTVLRVGKD